MNSPGISGERKIQSPSLMIGLYVIEMDYLFFSAEAESPAGYMLMRITEMFEHKFNAIHKSYEYSNKIDNICIVFICLSDKYTVNGCGKERKYISHKRKYADMRLRIQYEDFIFSSKERQIEICKETIKKSALYIKEKVADFNFDKFMNDINDLIDQYCQ